MTKTVEEVRRELFEAKFPIPKGNDGNPLATWVDDEKLYRVDVYPGEPYDDYGALWEGFNAALDAVEIQFPERDVKGGGSPDSEMGASLEQYEAVAYNFGLADCRAAIEQTGLGLRVK